MDEHPSLYDLLFGFGFGLSYTEFTYDSLDVSEETIADGGGVTVPVMVTNTGDRAGAETVQLFGKHRHSSVVTSVRELQGFTRVTLSPGETRTVMITLTADDLRVIKPDGSQTLESGAYELFVGDRT